MSVLSLLAMLFLTLPVVRSKTAPIHDAATKREMQAIQDYEKEQQKYLYSHLKSQRFFAPIFDEKANRFVWREFVCEKQLAEATSQDFLGNKKRPIHQMSQVWMRGGKPVSVSCFFVDYRPAEKWLRVITYFYRADGTVTSAFSLLRDIDPPTAKRDRIVFVGRYWFYDARGKLLSVRDKSAHDKAIEPKTPTF